MYSTKLGRFLQTDPIGYGDGMNIYAYCGSNPINWIDPWGLESKEDGIGKKIGKEALYEVIEEGVETGIEKVLPATAAGNPTSPTSADDDLSVYLWLSEEPVDVSLKKAVNTGKEWTTKQAAQEVAEKSLKQAIKKKGLPTKGKIDLYLQKDLRN